MKHLWEVDHDYYGPEGCFFARPHEIAPYINSFDSWADFATEDGGTMYDAMEGLNFLYRWDWKAWQWVGKGAQVSH